MLCIGIFQKITRIQFRTPLDGWQVLESIPPEIFKTIELFPKHGTRSNQPRPQRIFLLGTRFFGGGGGLKPRIRQWKKCRPLWLGEENVFQSQTFKNGFK